jgi:hypothetical protein
MYRNRFPAGAPPLEVRIMTRERRAGIELAKDVPNYETHSGKSMLKLVAAWMAMGFRRPQITWGTTGQSNYMPGAIAACPYRFTPAIHPQTGL